MNITSPIATAAINLLNAVKAWRDSDNPLPPFPDGVRMQIDAVLSAYELRTAGTFAERQATGTVPAKVAGPWSVSVYEANLARQVMELRLAGCSVPAAAMLLAQAVLELKVAE